jgi:hypothetical protein
LTRKQECFDQLFFAADGETGKSFEPFSLGHFRFGIEPPRQQGELFV